MGDTRLSLGQRAFSAVELITADRGGQPGNQNASKQGGAPCYSTRTSREVASLTGISRNTLFRAKRIVESGDEELIQAVADGRITLFRADQILRGVPSRAPASARTALYRHYDEQGRLLYVGISKDPENRGRSHARNSVWGDLAVSFTGVWFDTWEEARKAEVTAIRIENPIFNIAEKELT